MAVPEFQAFMLPVLRTLSDGQTRHWREVLDPLATALGLTPEDRQFTLSSGQLRFENRAQWSISHLFQARLVARPARGHVQITDRGKEVLAKQPVRIDVKFLSDFEEYQDFLSRSRSTGQGQTPGLLPEPERSSETPFEAIAEAVRESTEALATEVLQRVLDQEPVFLERLVLRLLTAMGYGGRAGVAEHRGGSGDGGIDGVVRQDILGLDLVYVQAKRYGVTHGVGRSELMAFVGALHGQLASRGVFITTSRFTDDAKTYVERLPNYRIVLIDGHRLAELMILHNVGVQDESTFVLKRIDEDFFEQP